MDNVSTTSRSRSQHRSVYTEDHSCAQAPDISWNRGSQRQRTPRCHSQPRYSHLSPRSRHVAKRIGDSGNTQSGIRNAGIRTSDNRRYDIHSNGDNNSSHRHRNDDLIPTQHSSHHPYCEVLPTTTTITTTTPSSPPNNHLPNNVHVTSSKQQIVDELCNYSPRRSALAICLSNRRLEVIYC